jgi:hypothetical protein
MTVVMKIMGGLASQMHKYSIGRRIADQCKTNLLLDISWFDKHSSTDTHREFQLEKYKVRCAIANEDEISKVKSNYVQRKTTAAFGKFSINYSLLKKTHYIKNLSSKNISTLINPVYIEGEWFGSSQIKDIKKDLQKDFSLQLPLNSNAQELLDVIAGVNSVAIHIRRGDYESNPVTSKVHFLTDLKYYLAAITQCKLVLENPTFYVFSDDTKWVLDNFSKIDGNFYFIQNNEAYEDLHLIKNCKHQIISNSGFGWFGSWLNENPSKLTIAPKLWVKDLQLNASIQQELSDDKMVLM